MGDRIGGSLFVAASCSVIWVSNGYDALAEEDRSGGYEKVKELDGQTATSPCSEYRQPSNSSF